MSRTLSLPLSGHPHVARDLASSAYTGMTASAPDIPLDSEKEVKQG